MKIPNTLHAELVRLHTSGKSYSELARWVKDVHHIDCSPSAIAKVCQSHSAAVRDRAVAKVVESVAETAKVDADEDAELLVTARNVFKLTLAKAEKEQTAQTLDAAVKASAVYTPLRNQRDKLLGLTNDNGTLKALADLLTVAAEDEP